MLLLGIGLSIPACLAAAWAGSIEVLILARIVGGLSAGMAYPTTLALITALWSGPGRTKSIALWSAIGGAIAALGPLVAGLHARALLVGFGVPRDAAARRGRLRARARARARATSTRRPSPSTTSAASCRSCSSARWCSRSTSRRCPNEGTLALGLGGDRGRRRASRSSCASGAPRCPLYDLTIAGAPDLLGRRDRRHHRVRLADGRDVHRPAVPAERARVLDASKPAPSILPAAVFMVLIAPRSAKLVEAQGARFTLLVRLRLLLPRLPHHARCCGRTTVPTGRSGSAYAFIGAGVGFAGTPGVALAHRLGAGAARRHGVGHRRPPARPRWRDHAVDLRRAAHRGLRGRVRRGHRGVAERERGHRQRRRRSSRSRSRARRRPPSSTRSTRVRSRRRRSHRSSTGRTGRTPRAASRSSSVP